jgi:ATP-dependent DNA ligase
MQLLERPLSLLQPLPQLVPFPLCPLQVGQHSERPLAVQGAGAGGEHGDGAAKLFELIVHGLTLSNWCSGVQGTFPSRGGRSRSVRRLATVLPWFDPMLAVRRPARVPDAAWAFEPKLDGWRALVYVDDGQLTVRTRRGRTITDQVPELDGLPDHLGRRCVLDGELVAGAGLPTDFYQLGPRLARRGDHLSHARRLTFVAFDVLWVDEGPTISLPYEERRRLLVELELSAPGWATVASLNEPLADVMDACSALALEGLVAKRLDAPYRPGVRSAAWLKLKTAQWLDFHAPRRIDARR